MNERNKGILAFVLNLLVVCFEVIALFMCVPGQHWRFFEFYTQDSNLVAMFAAAVMAYQQILIIRRKQKEKKKWAIVLKYIATCMLSVTFLVVVFALAPTSGGLKGYYNMMFSGAMLFHHFLCPVLTFVSFLFFDNKGSLAKLHTLIAIIPTVVYAIITVILNILKVIKGPYPFLMVYNQPIFMSVIWFVVIIGGAYSIAFLLMKLNNRTRKS